LYVALTSTNGYQFITPVAGKWT